jgi:hypothetical protein
MAVDIVASGVYYGQTLDAPPSQGKGVVYVWRFPTKLQQNRFNIHLYSCNPLI